MSQTDPNTPSPGSPLPTDLLKTIAGFFSQLHVILAFGGLSIVVFALLLLFGVDPITLVWFALAVLLFFLAMNIIDRWFALQEKKLSLTPNPPTPDAPRPTPDAPTPDAPAPNEQELSELYLKELIDRCGWVSTTAYDPKAHYVQAKKLHLTAVFTDLDVENEERREKMTAHAAQARQEELASVDMADKENRQSVLVSINRHPQLALLGKPGSGKSILVNYITLCLAGEALGKTEFNLSRLSQKGWALPALLPLRIVLRDYAARGLSADKNLWQFICDELQGMKDGRDGNLSPYAPHLEHTLKHRGGILLLDGYDEVPEAHERREQLQQAIAEFRRRFDKVRILVTSRPYAYKDAASGRRSAWQLTGFADTELLDFSPEQIDYYIEHWYKAVSADDPNLTEEQAGLYTQSLQEEVKSRNLRPLSPRPLLLAMMCSLHRAHNGRPLPQERHLLYEDSVDLLLDVWEQPKRTYDAAGRPSEERSAMVELGIPKQELRAVLNQIAYEVHAKQPELEGTADILGRDLAGLLYDAPSRKEGIDIDHIIDYIKNRAGLLEDRGPSPHLQGQHVYTFPHRTFQEYLAACHLSGPTFPTEIANLARENQTRWREALLLAAGRANTPYSVWGLVGKLCPTNAPKAVTDAPETDKWGAFLAGQALIETKLTAPVQDQEDQKRRRRVQEWQTNILTNGLLPPRDRALAGQALAALGDDRPGVLTCDDMPLCTVPGGPFWLENWDNRGRSDWYTGLDKLYWIAQYPVTAAQFREFVNDKERNNNFRPSRGDRPLSLPDNWPAVWINWYDALAFTEWLDERWRSRGWLPQGYRVTLPNEAEWEKAARGGQQIPQTAQITPPARLLSLSQQAPPMMTNDSTRRPYPWGDEPEQEALTPQETLYRANNKEAGIGEPCAVGGFPAGASPYGCLDLSGQVWEWTRSRYGDKYPYPPRPEYETISARNKETMVLRGGSFYNNQNGCSARRRDDPVSLASGGVRVVVSPFLTADR